ncbi:hypothetical protein ARMGADRAFT_693103 [Armillaria gallica]|uniref:Uncharacterized protein n=1 Tax=Armillaria gallica TaxID=47427 RepID=A0A2H3DY37_ARMGA|nr:hypothetical protein ARMGADRAFT_693103 [Armillaria gallica]
MDEKQMAPNDVRPLLSALAVDFLVSTQELFRCADHTPLRYFYLWHADLVKAKSIIQDPV